MCTEKKSSSEEYQPEAQALLERYAARDIVRKDKGLSGDLDRFPMLTWVTFLKSLEDLEHDEQGLADALAGKKFRLAVEPP